MIHSLFQENRRFDPRVPTEMYVSAYLLDRPQRGVTVDISESGLYLNALAQDPCLPHTPICLELKLPTTDEVLWVAGETSRDTLDDHFYGFGVRFTQMARLHRRLLREYCFRLRNPYPAREVSRRAPGLFRTC